MTGTSRPGDLYQVLGVPPDASPAEITRAYRRQARASHPDARPGGAAGAARFRAVAAAYHVLGDPSRRAAYDEARRPASPPAPVWPGPPLSSGPPLSPGPPLGSGSPAWSDPPVWIGTPVADAAGYAADDRARLALLALLLTRRPGGGRDRPW